MPPAFSDPVDVDGEDCSGGETHVDYAHRPIERLDVQPGLGALPHASGMRARGPVLSIGLKACVQWRGHVAPQLILILGIEVVE